MKIELYTWTSCPFCIRAKSLLDGEGLPYTEYVMDAKHAELDAVKRRYGHPTVPIVLIDGEFVGGYDQLNALQASGGLVGTDS